MALPACLRVTLLDRSSAQMDLEWLLRSVLCFHRINEPDLRTLRSGSGSAAGRGSGGERVYSGGSEGKCVL